MTIEEAIRWFEKSPFMHPDHEPFKMAIEALKKQLKAEQDVPSDPHDITYINALKNRIKELEADRPQGYWTKTDVATYRCSECGKKQIADDVNELNFCCCCGSRNKVRKIKGADDE